MAFSLDRILSSVNRGTFVFVALVVGTILIILADPPKTLCDTAVDQIRDSQAGFLFPAGANKQAKKLMSFRKMFEYCRKNASPGACYELFSRMKLVAMDLEGVGSECVDAVGEVKAIREAVWGSLNLLVILAWGEKGPEVPADKFSFLDTADMSLFCRLKRQAIRLYGQDSWGRFQESFFKTLPGATSLSRADAWGRMILSEDCLRYP